MGLALDICPESRVHPSPKNFESRSRSRSGRIQDFEVMRDKMGKPIVSFLAIFTHTFRVVLGPSWSRVRVESEQRHRERWHDFGGWGRDMGAMTKGWKGGDDGRSRHGIGER